MHHYYFLISFFFFLKDREWLIDMVFFGYCENNNAVAKNNTMQFVWGQKDRTL